MNFLHHPGYSHPGNAIGRSDHGSVVVAVVGGAGGGPFGGLRAPAGSGAVNGLYLIGGLVALALAGYLVYALLRAEEF